MLASTPRRHSPVTPSAATSCCSASLAVRLRACPDARGAVRGCSGRQRCLGFLGAPCSARRVELYARLQQVEWIAQGGREPA